MPHLYNPNGLLPLNKKALAFTREPKEELAFVIIRALNDYT